MRKFRILTLMVLCFIVLACGSLPDEVRKAGEMVPAEIEQVSKKVSQKKQTFENHVKNSDFSFFRPYAERENWPDHFVEADQYLKIAVSTNEELKKILDRNDPKDSDICVDTIRAIRSALSNAVEEASFTDRRMSVLEQARVTAEQQIKLARNNAKELNELSSALQSKAQSSSDEHPERKADITKLVEPIVGFKADADAALKKAESEFSKHQQNSGADYAEFVDNVALVKAQLDKATEKVKQVRGLLAELDTSETKILADMRIEYWVQIGRTSWDEYYDWPTEHTHLYEKAQVSPETFQYIAGLGEGVVARYGGWSGFSTGLDTNKLREAGLHSGNSQVNWTSGDDAAEYWVADFDTSAFHKYLVIKDGNQTETDWVPVDEEDFFDYEDALGMAIYSKPYGAFHAEKIEEPTPPGMDYVGNPHYGRWKTDSSGNSFWEFYGQYALMRDLLGGPGYGYYRADYDDWRSYRRNRAANGSWGYYGRVGSTDPRWGTYSKNTQANPRYSGSTYARSGGFKVGSVRGAGSAARGGGPGGRGK